MNFRTSSIVSAGAHVAFLGWCVLTFSGKPLDAAPQSIPVDVISAEQFSQITTGVEKAKPKETPKPLVEKKADEPKPAPEPVEKVVEKKPEIKPTSEPKPQPPAKEEKKPEKKVEEKKPDPIAEALKKEEKKPEPKKKEVVKEQPKFDASKIAALLDKRAPQRQASAGQELSNAPSLGTAQGSAKTLSQSEIDALRARLMSLWNPPAGAANPQELIVTVRIRLNIDGTLAGPPQVMTSGSSPFFMSACESAVRAVFRGQPFNMLSPSKYDAWKDIEITFDPRELVRG